MMLDLTGKTALVFGAGTYGEGIGIGKAIALAYAKANARIVLFDKSAEAVRIAHEMIAAEGGDSAFHTLDVTDYAAASALLRKIAAESPVDILYYNVGIGFAADTLTLDARKFETVLNANLVGLHNAVGAVLPQMRERRRGNVLVTGSAWSRRHLGYSHTLYATSKAAVDHYMRLIAVENAPYGIRANTILPGFIDTPRIKANLAGAYDTDAYEAMIEKRRRLVPLNRLGTPADIANLALFLASDLSSYITGTELVVDGGLSAAPVGT
ncbi:SDR family NAD(P)-dependent oxidoreductase [Nitratireductor indicus]|uniref:SDR family NAD(P)-dependent oxidoreductase n=1 Tax=Nitratireductor indicus TaxID=721133 RepID=UPI00287698CF|nr:SDR family NAD(P)-dependent oxidoreductase [Nitratireductor indicus]MDS1135141.1 SDR family NAD(P)-dependent oxidoreductase [Nitratireductor indicus]